MRVLQQRLQPPPLLGALPDDFHLLRSLLPELIDQPDNGTTRVRMCAATAGALMRWEPRLRVSRITLERGEKLASRFGGEVMHLGEVPARLHEFDAVISCTASTLPIIGLGAVERALKKRRHRPMPAPILQQQ